MVLLEDFDEVFLISYDFNTLNNFFWITPPTNWNFSWLISLCAASESALSSQGSWWQTSNKQALYYCGHIQLEKSFVKKKDPMHFKVQTLSFYLNTTTIITVQKLGKCPSKYMPWVFYVFMNSGSKSMYLGNKSQLIRWIKHSSSLFPELGAINSELCSLTESQI